MGSFLEAVGAPASRGQTMFRPSDDSKGLTRNGPGAPAHAERKEAGVDPRSKF